MRPAYACLVVLLFGSILAAPAHAAFTSNIAGPNVTMTGNSADDLLVISAPGAVLSHNRFPADPNFASATDFNTGTGGTQTVSSAVGSTLTINGGTGSDFVVIGSQGGTSAAALNVPFTVDGGSGTDALLVDSSADTAGRSVLFNSSLGTGTITFTGANGTYTHSDVEAVQAGLGSGPDTVSAVATDEAGLVGIDGGAGNDSTTVGGLFTGLANIRGRFDVEGGSGTDDNVLVNDGSSGDAGAYLVTPQGTHKAGLGDVSIDNAVERMTVATSSGPDAIFKTGPRAVTINANGGDDLISARDAIGDTANCGAGNDFVLTDPLDTLNDCEASDRTTPAPSGGGDPGTGTGGGTGTGTMMTTMMTMQAEMQDDAPPTAAISGVGKTIKLRTLLRGLRGMVAADERASYEVQLLGSTSSVRLTRTYNLTLARQNLGLDSGMRNIRLKPSRRLIGRARRFSVRVVVTPTDAAGNRGKPVTRTLKVRR